MARAQRFEDLVAWQKSRALSKGIFELTKSEPLARRHRLTSQIESAAVSVMSNIAEGFERDGPTEFMRFLTIAKASCGEVRSLLYVLLDAELLSAEEFARLKRQTEEVSRIIAGLHSSIQRSPKERGQETGSK